MWPSDLQFLDLDNANEEERNFLHTTLFTRNPNVKYPKLPWVTHTNVVHTPADWRPAAYASADSAEVPPTAATLEGSEINSAVQQQNAPSSVGQDVVPLEAHSAAVTGAHTTPTVYAEAPIMPVPQQIPTSVSAAPPPSVMTTMYLPHSVYVSNVTANVNVHPYVNPPYGAYQQHISPQQVYTGDMTHEVPPTRNGGRESRRGRGKTNNKRIDGRHSQEVIATQPPPHVDSPPTGTSNMPQQNYPMYPISPMHHAYPQYYPAGPSHPAHISHHPSAQHATGTPIYLPGPMYGAPALYGAYPAHQAAATTIMPFATPMQSAPVPTTENSVLESYQVESVGTEEHMPVPPPTITSHKGSDIHQQKNTVHESAYSSDAVQDVCQQPGVQGVKSTSYQQQHSEEEEYSQANLANTVVVNNSNIVSETPSFVDTKHSSDGETKHRNLGPSSGPLNFSDSSFPKFTSSERKATKPDTSIDDSVSLSQTPKGNAVESVSVNTVPVVSDVEKKQLISGVTLPPSIAQHEKSIVDIKSPPPNVDVPTLVVSPKSATGPSADSVAPFASNPQSTNSAVNVQTSGQNMTAGLGGSQVIEIPSAQVTTPVQNQKSWASLFKSSGDPGMMAGAPLSGASGGLKPFACVKPFPNAVTVGSESARRICDLSSAQAVPVTASPVDNSTKGSVFSFPHVQPQAMLEDPHLYRLGEFLSTYQPEHKAVSLQPRGLTNRSNWCYINSTLQALIACPPFYNLMKAMSSRRSTTKTTPPVIDSMVQFVSEFMPLSAASRPRDRKEKAVRKDDGSIEDQCGPPFEPSYIYKMLNNIRSDTFKVEGRQEDAEEFLSCLLNALNDEMLELIKRVEVPTSKTTLSNGDLATNGDTSAQSQDEDDAEWKEMGPKKKGSITRRADFGRTPISDIFRGQLRSRVQRAGDHSTDNVQPFFTLQLDIEKAQSVKDALENLVGKDQLEGVTCSKTNQEIEAWQQVTLEELPLVLLLHLKWFDYKLGGTSKIVKNVEFPIDLKVDPKLMSSAKKYSPKQRQYKLFAVVYHDGKEATKGHYVTDVYHVGYGGWVRYDDSVVKAVQENVVLRPRGPCVPYLLYYRRCDTIGSAQPSQSASDKTR